VNDRRSGIVAADKRHVWHPYTAMDDYEASDPLVIARAKGARLFDVDGRSYLDGNSSWYVAALGHGHPRLLSALRRQSEELSHCALAGITHEPAARLAEDMARVAPAGLSRVFFTDDGSTAVESAVKMAVQYFVQTGRPEKTRFIALEGAFHGDTVGASSLGGVEVFRRPFASLLFDCVRVPSPADPGAYEQAFDAFRTLLAREGDSIAAVVIEPLVQAAGGMKMYGAALLSELRALCDRHHVLLIADEVFTGYGRTGTFWACDQAKVSPDLLCTAKGFSGGILPMGATLATEAVYDAFRGPRENAFYYGHSFCGNPLGAAVAREVLRVFEEERVIDGIAERSARIASTFRGLERFPRARRARSLGMIGAIDLEGEAGGYLSRLGWRVYEEARRRGAYLRPLGDVVYVTPPLNIPLDDLAELLSIVDESVAAVMATAG
jgi:adenosylmethionine---8-amino-7-oxononanoate aminotransferase